MKKWIKDSCGQAASVMGLLFAIIPEACFSIISCPLTRNISFLGIEIAQESVNAIVGRILLLVVGMGIIIGHRFQCTSVSLKKKNYMIKVEYGDLLAQENCQRVINFDECYTTKVGINPADIKASSICGQYLMRIKENEEKNFDISELIRNSNLKAEMEKSRFHGKERYKSGSIVARGDDLLLAFARLDENGSGRFFTRDEYIECLSTMWKQINIHYVQKDVCIPILGSGVTRFDDCDDRTISKQELLNIIIKSYQLSSDKIKSPNKLRIICQRSDDFSLNNIEW